MPRKPASGTVLDCRWATPSLKFSATRSDVSAAVEFLPWTAGGNRMSEDGGKGIPDGASVVIPRLFCRDAVAEIEFCEKTFGAVERVRRLGPNGSVAHALMTIGPAMIMIEAEWPELTSRAPKLDGSSPVVIYVYVEDVDKTVERAVDGGAKVLFPVANQFWGDRIGWVMDPSGHVLTVATRIEETTEGERRDRWSGILAGSDPGTAREFS
jgi:PhnB protein